MTSNDTIYLSQASVPQLGNLPDNVVFLYSIQQARLTPANVTLTPADVATDHPLTWALTQAGGWFISTPSSGTSPQSFEITPGSFDTSTPTTYTGSLTVTVSDPPSVLGSPHKIDLILRVIDALANKHVIGGLPLGEHYPALVDCIVVCATEKRTNADIEHYRAALTEVLHTGALA